MSTYSNRLQDFKKKIKHIITCCSVVLPKKITRKASDVAENLQLKGSMKEPNILIYFFFPSITQSCSVSNVLFTGGRGVSDFQICVF